MKTDTNDPWDQFETLAELLGYTYSRHGGGGAMRELLDQLGAEDETKDKADLWHLREHLWATAEELESVGLKEAAAIVAEYAEKAPHELECCPYEEGSPNAKSWYNMARQKYGLCPYCDSDEIRESYHICSNGQTCIQRLFAGLPAWQLERQPRYDPLEHKRAIRRAEDYRRWIQAQEASS